METGMPPPRDDCHVGGDRMIPIVHCDGSNPYRKHGLPVFHCSHCFLAKYCTEACRAESLAKHLADCVAYHSDDKRPHNEQQRAYEEFSFWGMYAATDLLNLANNEGPAYEGSLRLLTSTEFSARHLLQTLYKLPTTAKPSLEFVLSEGDRFHLFRTIAVLLLLLGEKDQGLEYKEQFDIDVETAIHTAYSTRLTPQFAKRLEDLVLAPIRERCRKAVDESRARGEQDGQRAIPVLVSFPTAYGCLEIRILPTEHEVLIQHCQAPDEADVKEFPVWYAVRRAQDLRDNASPIGNVWKRMTDGRVMALKKWRERGLLLPHRHKGTDFTVQNAIFFAKRSLGSPDGIIAEPITEWGMDIYEFDGVPESDVYAKMLFKCRQVFSTAKRRLRDLPAVRIRIFDCAGEHEHFCDVIPTNYFDRIETGQSIEYNAKDTLTRMSRLLKHTDQNPHAVGFCVTRITVSTPIDCTRHEIRKEIELYYVDCGTALDDLAPAIPKEDLIALIEVDPQFLTYDRGLWRRQMGLELWRNSERFSDRFMATESNYLCSTTDSTAEPQSVCRVGYMGLNLQKKNRVTRRWPNRLVHSRTDRPASVLFDRHIGWPDINQARWLEWKKDGVVKGVSDEEWKEWHKEWMDREKKRSLKYKSNAISITQAKEVVEKEPDLSWIDNVDPAKVGGGNGGKKGGSNQKQVNGGKGKGKGKGKRGGK